MYIFFVLILKNEYNIDLFNIFYRYDYFERLRIYNAEPLPKIIEMENNKILLLLLLLLLFIY